MPVLASLFNISKSFGARTVFKDITFAIESGQRIGLIGPNGAGKSTLLHILAQNQTVDDGKVSLNRGLRIGFLEQSPQFTPKQTIIECILSGAADADDPDNIALAYELVSKLELDQFPEASEAMVDSLSGGWKKRVALARELMKRPELLLLDEPTNHLDVPSILWLENFMQSQGQIAIMMITHDRLFLERTCDHIFDLDARNPDGLIKFKGPYSQFLVFKDELLQAQRKQEQVERNRLTREVEWLRRGAQARQTKQKARIDRAGDLADKVDDLRVRNLDRRIDLDFGNSGRSPKKMAEFKAATKSYSGRTLIKNFNFTLAAGARVGLLGRNGAGKSTLIRLLLGTESPDLGSVKLTDGVTFSYFEQQKESLDPKSTVLRAICPEGDYVHVQGSPVYARSYLSRFLFRSEQMDMPVEKLSGGEQSRLLIARLMLSANQLLVLDEPTNDLDVATLDVLEDALAQFPGTVILVTHDRYFMDHVVTKILALTEQDGQIIEFADTLQWEKWYQESQKKGASRVGAASNASSNADDKEFTNGGGSASLNKNSKAVKLSYKDQRDWETIESRIAEEENKLSLLNQKLARPEVSANFQKLQEITSEASRQQETIDKLYARWQELSEKVNQN